MNAELSDKYADRILEILKLERLCFAQIDLATEALSDQELDKTARQTKLPLTKVQQDLAAIIAAKRYAELPNNGQREIDRFLRRVLDEVLSEHQDELSWRFEYPTVLNPEESLNVFVSLMAVHAPMLAFKIDVPLRHIAVLLLQGSNHNSLPLEL